MTFRTPTVILIATTYQQRDHHAVHGLVGDTEGQAHPPAEREQAPRERHGAPVVQQPAEALRKSAFLQVEVGDDTGDAAARHRQDEAGAKPIAEVAQI